MILRTLLLAGIAATVPLAAMAAGGTRSLDSVGPSVVIGLSDTALCVMETQRDNISEAYYWCDRAIRRAESSIDERSVAYMHRGVVHLKTHDIQAAIKDLDKSIELTPHYGDAHFNKANALFALGRYQDAVDCYGQALANNPTTPDLAHYNRGKAYERLGKGDLAKTDMQQAMALMPEDSPLVARLGKRP
ncbi:tetratricopeptide repeat protein [Aerophototrophica crusticola]|uniref:Tetratricopeptide repeat protein n=1 Tax=Aerophototrophica crusticola TaxID=1709002 RepID=A0A858R7Q9_9PROT|nr:tetratricopeptide repeat protein [Rhodospirillaceae bacterium B3]